MFIQCTECGKRYSNRAPACPFCGAPRGDADDERRFSRQERKVDGRTITSVCDHSEVAKEAVEELGANGIRLDYSLASLATLDQYVSDRFGPEGFARHEQQWRPGTDERRWIAMLGSYAGEVIRRRLGGGWADDPDKPGMPLFVRLELDGRAVVWPLERAYRRLKNGTMDRFESFGQQLLNELGEDRPLDEDGMDFANQATLFIRQERYDVALRFAVRAVESNPTLAEGWLCRGFVETQLGETQTALRSYEEALRLAPPEERDLIAHIKQQIQDLTAGIGNFRRAPDPPTLEPSASSVGGAESGGSGTYDALPDFGPQFEERDFGSHAAEILEPAGPERDAFSEEPPSVVQRIRDLRSADPKLAEANLGTMPPMDVRSASGDPFAAFDAQRQQARDAVAPKTASALQPDPATPGLAFADTMQGDDPSQRPLRLEADAETTPPDDEPAQPPAERTTAQGNSLRPITASEAEARSTEESPAIASLVQLSRGQFDEATRSLQQHVSQHPDDDTAWLWLAQSQFLAGELNAALGSVRRTLRLVGDHSMAHELHCLVLVAMELYDQALEACDRAEEVIHGVGWLPLMRAEVLYALEEFAASVESYEDAIRLDPTFAPAWLGRGLAELECGRIEEARIALQAFVTMAPPSASASVRTARRELAKLNQLR